MVKHMSRKKASFIFNQTSLLQEGKRNGEFRITASVNGISSIMGDYVDDKLEVGQSCFF